MTRKGLAPVIAVINMKGGVGKTTISAHLFRVMFEILRVGTLIIDLDPQFNLTQAVFTRSRYDSLKKRNKTVYQALEPYPSSGLFTIRTSLEPPPRPIDIGEPLWYVPNTDPRESLVVIPGDFDLVKYNLMHDNRKLEAVQQRFSDFIKMARHDYKIVVIDCNPSSSFLTLCALHACTHMIVPVRPDRYSILGLELISDFVDGIPTIIKKPDIIVVLNGVPRNNYKPKVENDLRAHRVFGTLTLANRIYESGLLVANPDYTGFATDRRVSHRRQLMRELNSVAIELSQRLGL